MKNLKSVVMAAAVASMSLPAWIPASHAETATKVAASDTKAGEADMRAKAADCSKQADEKKLHGAARKKFREACKRK